MDSSCWPKWNWYFYYDIILFKYLLWALRTGEYLSKFFYSSQAHNTGFLVIYFEVNDNIWFQETWKWTLNKITDNNNVHCRYSTATPCLVTFNAYIMEWKQKQKTHKLHHVVPTLWRLLSIMLVYGNHEVDKRAFIYRWKEVKVLVLTFLRKHLHP